MGDNIYYINNGHWKHVPSHHSLKDGSLNEKNIVRDTSKTSHVLIGSNFWYWGGEAVAIPPIHDVVKKGPSHRSNFDEDNIKDFLQWLNGLESKGLIGLPLEFPL